MVAEISSAVAVKTEVVKNSTYSMDFTSTGMVAALSDLPFVSDVSGRIVKINVAEGDLIKKGQVLIQLDDDILRANFISAEATYNGLKKDYERFKNSNAQGGVTDQQLDNIHNQLVAAESHFLVSKRHLDNAAIKAPISGTIYRRYIETGSYLNPGAKLFDIIDDSQLKVMCFVTEKQLLHISKGQEVTVTTEIFPGEVFTGKITFISSKADFSFNFPVEVRISNTKKELKSGMLVTVHMGSVTPKTGITVPRNAISGSVLTANVYLVKNGTARKQAVTTGNIVGEQIEVVEGINVGDSIIVAGLINISDGTQIKNIE